MLPEISKAAAWLLKSGIQNRSRNPKLAGGIAAWYELDKKLYPFLYSEITGYAVTAFVFLHRLSGDRRFLAAASRAADWLIRNAFLKNGGVKTRFYLVPHYVSPNYCFHYGRVYAFDAAMVAYGLLQAHRAAGNPVYLKSAGRILDFLTQQMKKESHLFYPYFDSAKSQCGEDFEKWSDQAGSFHAKLALFFTDMHQTTGSSFCKANAQALLDAVLKKQKKDGRFITGAREGSTHLHPHAYTLEGLLYSGVAFGRKDYVEGAVRGFEWMLEAVSQDGSVSSIYENGSYSHHERSDIVAQTLRLGSALSGLRPIPARRWNPVLARVKKHLLHFQVDGGPRGQAGGFLYGFATDGLLRNHLNAWSTMFAIQALWMHDEFVIRKKPVRLDNFI